MITDFAYQATMLQENMPFTDLLEETNGIYEDIYIGYAKSGTQLPTETTYAICLIRKDTLTGITTRYWANGTKKQQCSFALCKTYTYKRLL